MTDTATHGTEVASLMQRILYEVKKVIVGQDHFLERVLVAILSQGRVVHVGPPSALRDPALLAHHFFGDAAR